MFPYMVDSVRRTLFSPGVPGVIKPGEHGWTSAHADWANPELQQHRRPMQPETPWRFIQGAGIVSGPLLGGCTDVLEFMKGTELWPQPAQWDKAILFMENSEEAPSPQLFKWWLRNYGAQGIFDRIAGIIFGRPGGNLKEADFIKYDQVLCQVVGDEYGRPDMPIVTAMDFGHSDPMFVLPMGCRAAIDCEKKQFAILEAGVL